ncbi:hypothetical protein LEP1GSC133_0879 [Leptospira borgpetersenii serovar Pomona str. 200901868]|uniref:Uncharacterized protein n=1 Tax=Leptospira borgpetersenii serovar Pomona str. 200901868 TaxID=1192866 RepID=M6W546_LEPBO|nr:hypothetical protein LEP1GSC133_0879 [Leptospira borgpetersenii serovar Pomona str. 200901868]
MERILLRNLRSVLTPQGHIDPGFFQTFFDRISSTYFKTSLNDLMDSLKYISVLGSEFRTDSVLTM